MNYCETSVSSALRTLSLMTWNANSRWCFFVTSSAALLLLLLIKQLTAILLRGENPHQHERASESLIHNDLITIIGPSCKCGRRKLSYYFDISPSIKIAPLLFLEREKRCMRVRAMHALILMTIGGGALYKERAAAAPGGSAPFAGGVTFDVFLFCAMPCVPIRALSSSYLFRIIYLSLTFKNSAYAEQCDLIMQIPQTGADLAAELLQAKEINIPRGWLCGC